MHLGAAGARERGRRVRVRTPLLLLAAPVALLAAVLFLRTAHAADPLLPGINGTDDRRLSEALRYPWSAIGRVNRRTGGFCTGSLIAPDRVLTAAHCLWNRRTQGWFPADSLHFVAGYNRGAYLAESGVTALHFDRAFDITSHDAGRNLVHDWAVLILERPIGKITGVLPLAAGVSGTRVMQAGYSQDKAHILTVDEDCRLTGSASGGRLIFHDCDATHGDSGSPILVRTPGGVAVIAVVSSAVLRRGVPMGVAVAVAGLPLSGY